MNKEDNYWKDFRSGKSLEKYGSTKVLKKWIIPKEVAEELFFGNNISKEVRGIKESD